MSIRALMLIAVFFVAPIAHAAEPLNLGALSSAEAEKVEAAKAAALKNPALKDVNDKYKAARKAYQLDRAKFANERDRQVSVDYRKATKELDDAVRRALLAADPTIAALLEKAERKPNEGETVADSDVGKNPAIRAIKDEPGLARVLLIGDSISIGYTLPVREKLKGRANVHRIPVNGGATEVGLEHMKDWLGDSRWDVIHFNFGLHDAKYTSETTQRASREQYEQNLREIVAQLKPTGAKLIFATTTPVPKGGVLTPTRKFDSITARNEIAIKVMQGNDVAIDDLYTAVLPEQEKVGRPNDVHYSPEGYELLATAVAASIAAQLPAEPKQEEAAKTSATHVVLVGDSTVTDQAGWGQAFAELLAPGVKCTNTARGGQSTKSFLDGGNWAKALELKPTHVLIQFGHNDQPGKGPNRETDPATTYRVNLRRYVDEARAAGAQPILVTSLTRRGFRDGKIADSLGPYAEAMRAVAKEKDVPLVDLHARSIEAVEKLGPEKSEELGPLTPEGKRDHTHLAQPGKVLFSGIVRDELIKVAPEMSKLFKPSTAGSEPALPRSTPTKKPGV